MITEKKIQNLISSDSSSIDADVFLNKLHRTRENKLQNQNRLKYGISSLVIVFLVGVLSISQLNNSVDTQYNQYFTDSEMTEEMIDEYYDELMVYLVDETDDIWSTMEFFYEIDNPNDN